MTHRGTDRPSPIQNGNACPLCGDEGSAPSWLGSMVYLGREFSYVACGGCQSLYCAPMPDEDLLASMYGTGYAEGAPAPHDIPNPREPQWVLEWLDRQPPGAFVDYGCGRGELLVEAAGRGWDVLGVELAEEVAREVRKRTGHPVLTVQEASDRPGIADVLHVGDVLEHLTDLEIDMRRILSLVKPGGLFLAQGPLEANGNLYTWILRLARWLKRYRPIEMPPHHVILATLAGQRALFRRYGLTTVEERVTEVSWPAPDRLSRGDLFAPRIVGLYLLRLASRSLSRYRSHHWGNRYRYAGRTRKDRAEVGCQGGSAV